LCMYSQKTKRNSFSSNSLEKTREWNDIVSVINKLMERIIRGNAEA
jgi:hypothetical protein